MTKRPSPRQPRPDRAHDALGQFVEALLDDFFTDPDNQNDYEMLARGGRKAGVKAGETVSIGSMQLSDHGEVEMNMRAGSPEITVTINHPRFNASIAAHYGLDTATMTQFRIVKLEGDHKMAGKSADAWDEQLTLAGLDDDDDDDHENLEAALEALLGDDESPFAKAPDPGAPRPPSARDKAMVENLAKMLGREMKRKRPNLVAHEHDLIALEQCPQSLWPILDGMIAASTASPRDEAMIGAWEFLLESQLTLIRYRIDRGWDWAVRMAGEFQRKLIEIGNAGQVPPRDFAAMLGALGEARIEVTPETRVALADAGLTLPRSEQPEELVGAMRELMDQMAAAVASPFEVAGGLGEATRVMPSEVRGFMAHEFALSHHAVLRDTVPLMLLAEDQEVRRTAAAALEQTASMTTMSPEALRRMIAIRNWVPEADRPPIDQAIRKARTSGVECAQWPPARDLNVTASMIDGSGAQSVLLTTRSGRQGVLAGALLKLGVGVADSWCDTDSSRRDINETLAALRDSGGSADVDRTYLDDAIQNVIAAGAAHGRPPGHDLLQIAELAGGAAWQDRRLDIAAEAQRLFDALPAEQRSPAAIGASLARSGAWIHEHFARSWFLDDADVRAIARSGSRRDMAGTVRRLLVEAMPKRRAEWAERFLLLALRARAAVDRANKAYTNDFIVLAKSLSGDLDLAAIPLMNAIARHTIEIARIAR